MNKDKIKDMVRKKAKGNNEISAQLYQMYFFERILERISVSPYKNNIMLKGGLLLASIIGEDARTTKDMDANFKSIALDLKTIEGIMKDILFINFKDQIVFKLKG